MKMSIKSSVWNSVSIRCGYWNCGMVYFWSIRHNQVRWLDCWYWPRFFTSSDWISYGLCIPVLCDNIQNVWKSPECIFIVLDFRVCPVAQMATCGNNSPLPHYNDIIWEQDDTGVSQMTQMWEKCVWANLNTWTRCCCCLFVFRVIVFISQLYYHHESTNDYTNYVTSDLNHAHSRGSADNQLDDTVYLNSECMI